MVGPTNCASTYVVRLWVSSPSEPPTVVAITYSGTWLMHIAQRKLKADASSLLPAVALAHIYVICQLQGLLSPHQFRHW